MVVTFFEKQAGVERQKVRHIAQAKNGKPGSKPAQRQVYLPLAESVVENIK